MSHEPEVTALPKRVLDVAVAKRLAQNETQFGAARDSPGLDPEGHSSIPGPPAERPQRAQAGSIDRGQATHVDTHRRRGHQGKLFNGHLESNEGPDIEPPAQNQRRLVGGCLEHNRKTDRSIARIAGHHPRMVKGTQATGGLVRSNRLLFGSISPTTRGSNHLPSLLGRGSEPQTSGDWMRTQTLLALRLVLRFTRNPTCRCLPLQ